MISSSFEKKRPLSQLKKLVNMLGIASLVSGVLPVRLALDVQPLLVSTVAAWPACPRPPAGLGRLIPSCS